MKMKMSHFIERLSMKLQLMKTEILMTPLKKTWEESLKDNEDFDLKLSKKRVSHY